MKFSASAEIHQPASFGMLRAHRCVLPFLNAAFAASSLATIDGELRYVPIIMPEGMRERYPPRSKLRKKERLYDCAPQLNYEIFVNGTFEEQLEEYIRGISESASHLAGLGASPEADRRLHKIMASAVESILAERPDQTRH